MINHPLRAVSSLAPVVLLLLVAGCAYFDHPFVPEEPVTSDCLLYDDEADGMVSTLPIREGYKWEFSLFVSEGPYPVFVDSTVVFGQSWKRGTVTLRFMEIQPCQDSTQTITIEKQSAYWDISKWVDDTLVVKHDSTFTDTTETLQWLATSEEIRMNAKPFSMPIPRFVESAADTLVFERPCYRCEERLVVTPESGILEYDQFWFSHLDDPGTSVRWTRR